MSALGEEYGATMCYCAQSDPGVSMTQIYLQMGLNMLEMHDICEMFDRSRLHAFSTAYRY